MFVYVQLCFYRVKLSYSQYVRKSNPIKYMIIN